MTAETKQIESQKRKAVDILDDAFEGAHPQKARRAGQSSQTSDLRALLTRYLHFQNPGDFVDEIQRRAYGKSLVEVGATVEPGARNQLVVTGKFVAVVFGKAESELFMSRHFNAAALSTLRRMLAATRLVQIESCPGLWRSETLARALFRNDECALEVLIINEAERLNHTGKLALLKLLEQQQRTLRSVSLSRSTVVWSPSEFKQLHALFVPPVLPALPVSGTAGSSSSSSSSPSTSLPPLPGTTPPPATRVYPPVCVDTYVADTAVSEPRLERIKWPLQHEHCGLASHDESTFSLDIAGLAADHFIAAAVNIRGTSTLAKLSAVEEKHAEDGMENEIAWPSQCMARVEITCHYDHVHVEWLLSRLIYTPRGNSIGLCATTHERDVLRGIVPAVLAYLLRQLAQRGVYERTMLVTLVAAVQLADVDMAGLVKYYQTLSFRPDAPASLQKQIGDGQVRMNTTIGRILDLVPFTIRPLPAEITVREFQAPFEAKIRAPPESAHILETVRRQLLDKQLSMFEDVRIELARASRWQAGVTTRASGSR